MFALFFLTVPFPPSPLPPTDERVPHPKAAIENIVLLQKEDIGRNLSGLLSRSYGTEEREDELGVNSKLKK